MCKAMVTDLLDANVGEGAGRQVQSILVNLWNVSRVVEGEPHASTLGQDLRHVKHLIKKDNVNTVLGKHN